MTDLPDAEDMRYWKSSQSRPRTWIGRAEELIEEFDGEVIMTATGKRGGREAYCIEFQFNGQTFRAVWPVLPTRTGAETAAKRQAATMLYRDIKTRMIRLQIHGPKIAFFEYMMLPDGRVAGQLPAPELSNHTPEPLLPE